MSYEKPDYQDVDIILRLYELRREKIMRQSRNAINSQFWPASYDDFLKVTDPAHPMNAAFRQVSSYWEMVYGFARREIINPDFLVENNGEGILMWAKFHAYVPQWRKEGSPYAFKNTEWIVQNSQAAQMRFEVMKARVQKQLEKVG